MDVSRPKDRDGGSYHLFTYANFRLPTTKSRLLLLFVAVNFTFIFIDVAIAHAVGGFIPVFEWIPVIYTPFAALVTFFLVFSHRWDPTPVALFVITMGAGVAVGIMGSAFHYLGSTFLGGRPVLNLLIFGSPVAAPLSIAGVALVGLVTALIGDQEELEEAPRDAADAPAAFRLHHRTHYLMWLLALGFLTTTIVVILDHARGGFTNFVEWVPVVAGLFGFWTVTLMAMMSEPYEVEAAVFTWSMLGNILVGITGFALHLSADLTATGQLTLDGLLQKAPILAPLLFSNLGLFGLLTVIEPGRVEKVNVERVIP